MTDEKEQTASIGQEGEKDLRIIDGFDSTFHVALVYAYGTFDAYRKLRDKFFSDSGEDLLPSKGACTFGKGDESIGTPVALVWVNSAKLKLQHSLPVFVHEIVHLSQAILEWAGVSDSSGETQAYMVGRECERVLRELFNLNLPVEKPTVAIEKLLEDSFGPLEEDTSPVLVVPNEGGSTPNGNTPQNKNLSQGERTCQTPIQQTEIAAA